MPEPLIADRYRLRQSIGDGGMGRVWLATDELLCRDVALKEIVPPPGLTEQQREHLGRLAFREAQAMAQVDHPNVVAVHDIVQSGQWPWVVMQYVPSRSVLHLVRDAGPVSPACAARIGLSLLDALDAIHRAGVLHRDVTPQNVLIRGDGSAVLADFGVALWPAGGGEDAPELQGTAQYTAPERILSGESTVAGDLWSLGATLYTAVEGRSPYSRPSVSETLSAIVRLPPDPPLRAGQLTPLLSGLLEREPRLRPSSAEARAMLMHLAAAAGRDTPSPSGWAGQTAVAAADLQPGAA